MDRGRMKRVAGMALVTVAALLVARAHAQDSATLQAGFEAVRA